jgi:transcriptional regulator with XRE-family HTH domain
MTMIEEEREHPSPMLAPSGAQGLINELRARRHARGLTLAQVGALVDRAGPTVAHWETGRHLPDANQLTVWAQALGLAVGLYEPVNDPRVPSLPPEMAEPLTEVIDVLARMLLGDEIDDNTQGEDE